MGPIPRLSHYLDGSRWGIVLATVDASALVVAMAICVLTKGEGGPAWPMLLFPFVAMAMLAGRGSYRASPLRAVALDDVRSVFETASIAAMTVLAAVHLSEGPGYPFPFLRTWLSALVVLAAGRVAVTYLQRLARTRGWVRRPVLVVGAGDAGRRAARRLQEHPEYGLQPAGFLDGHPSGPALPGDPPVLGRMADLAEVVETTGTRHVILAFSDAPTADYRTVMKRCLKAGIEVSVIPREFESVSARARIEHVGEVPLVRLALTDPRGWRFGCKHAIDRILAALGLIVLLPCFVGVAIAVLVTSPGPILFRQRRVGRDGREFDLLKFRSMRIDDHGTVFRPVAGSAPGGVEGDDRRTRVGRMLRRTSLDELPQLLNVLRGDMSLVGPRPERPEFVRQFAQDIARYGDRHRVKAGITGWSQVHGLRGQTSIAKRADWDNHYIQNWSLWLDAKILLLTVIALFTPSEA